MPRLATWKQLVTISAMVFGLGLGIASHGQQDLSNVARSQIEANIPLETDFDAILRRDLTDYFRRSTQVPVKVEYELLRKGPTQSGIAYPKFYAWVKVFAQSKPTQQGAVRVAAIEKVRFDVTDFLSEAEIALDPSAVRRVFPAELVPSILERAGAK